MKEITILGAGFAGLACAYYLASAGVKVRVCDPSGIGGGASGVSAGLLHPYTGPHAKCNQYGIEGMQATLELIDIAEKALGRPVAQRNGILRLAMNEQQQISYAKCAAEHSDVIWCDAQLPGVQPYPGIYIRSAVAVNVKAYLQGLWKACEKLGATFTKEEHHSEPLIFALGAATLLIEELKHLPITPVKGQILQLEWPKNLPPLSYPINSKSYIVMSDDQKSCWVGASFERNFTSSNPDIETAKREILPNAIAMIPALEKAAILDCQTGIRASTGDKFPIAKEIAPQKWVFTGLGSKGLLYHALFAKQLCNNITESHI